MRFKPSLGMLLAAALSAHSAAASAGEGREGMYDAHGNALDSVAMRESTGEAYVQAKANVDEALAKIRACKALQPPLLANLEKGEQAFAAYQSAMEALYYPTAESKSGTLYAAQNTQLKTLLLQQHLALLTPVYKGDQRAEWCGK